MSLGQCRATDLVFLCVHLHLGRGGWTGGRRAVITSGSGGRRGKGRRWRGRTCGWAPLLLTVFFVVGQFSLVATWGSVADVLFLVSEFTFEQIVYSRKQALGFNSSVASLSCEHLPCVCKGLFKLVEPQPPRGITQSRVQTREPVGGWWERGGGGCLCFTHACAWIIGPERSLSESSGRNPSSTS